MELYVTVYVDDNKAFARADATIDDLSTFISKKYELTDLGDLKWYLGMEINGLLDGSLFLNRLNTSRDLLHKHGMVNCARVSTPQMTHVQLTGAPDG